MAQPSDIRSPQGGLAQAKSQTGQADKEADKNTESTGLPKRELPPSSIIPLPAGTKPSAESEEEKALNDALAAYNKAGGSKGGGLFLLKDDGTALLQKKLDDIDAMLTKGKKVRDLMVEMTNPQISEEEDKNIRKDLPVADRSALDYLLGRGPEQLTKPEVNVKSEAMQLIGTSIMNMVASAVNSMGTTTGTTMDPGARASSEMFGQQAARIQLTEDKIREIEEKQTAIDIKYRDDVVSAMQAYDADMDETARMYLAERNQAMSRKLQATEAEINYVMNQEQKSIALTGQITEMKNAKEMFNLKQKQDYSQAQGSMAREQAKFIHDWRQNRQLMSKMSAERLVTAIGGEKTIVELQSSNLDGISVSSVNNDMSTAISRAQADPKYGEAFTNHMYVYSGDMKEAAQAQYNYLESKYPHDDTTKKRVREETRILVKMFGRVPGRQTTEALIANPLTPTDQGSTFSVPNAVLDALTRENGDLIASPYQPGMEVLPVEAFALKSFGSADGSSTPELDAAVFSYDSYTNQLVSEKWKNRMNQAKLTNAEKPK